MNAPSRVEPAPGAESQPGGSPRPPDSTVIHRAGKAPRLGFPKSRRVRDRPEFQRIQNRGQRLGGHALLVLAMRQQGKPRPARLGITASRKTGESVQRNRIRRLVREAFRLNPGLFPDGWDLVVICREASTRLALSAVVLELRGAAARLKQGPPPPRAPRK